LVALSALTTVERPTKHQIKLGKKPSSSKNDWQAKLKECQEAAVNWQRYDWLKTESIEANDLPPMKTDGKRKMQMDKKLRRWLIEADGTKKAISCREICEQST